jgi:hypothetical protein
MNVIAAVLTGQGDYKIMKHFTIDSDNNITVHPSKKAARETGAAVFSSEEQFADVIGPDNKRLVEIWNSLPGVKPVAKFANRKVAAERIWKAIQGLGEASAAPSAEPQAPGAETTITEVPEAQPNTPAHPQPPVENAPPTIESRGALSSEPPANTTELVATLGAQAADVAPAPAESSKKATPAKRVPRGKKAAKPQDGAGPREGSKTAQVVAMLQRKERSHTRRDYGKDGLAEAHGPRFHGRHDEKGGIYRRILQARGWGADLPDQPVASRFLPGPPGSGRGGLFSSVGYAVPWWDNMARPSAPYERGRTVA